MAEYHTVYKGPEGETTQWEDIQTKLGNMAPKPKPWKPDAYKPEEEQRVDQEFLSKAHDQQQLQDLEDEFDDDRALEEYRCAQQLLQTSKIRVCQPLPARLLNVCLLPGARPLLLLPAACRAVPPTGRSASRRCSRQQRGPASGR